MAFKNVYFAYPTENDIKAGFPKAVSLFNGQSVNGVSRQKHNTSCVTAPLPCSNITPVSALGRSEYSK